MTEQAQQVVELDITVWWDDEDACWRAWGDTVESAFMGHHNIIAHDDEHGYKRPLDAARGVLQACDGFLAGDVFKCRTWRVCPVGIVPWSFGRSEMQQGVIALYDALYEAPQVTFSDDDDEAMQVVNTPRTDNGFTL